MSRASVRSQLRSRDDIALYTTNEHLDDEEVWYTGDDLNFPSVPGLKGDALSAAYILKAVDAPSGPRITPERDYLAFRPPNASRNQAEGMIHRRMSTGPRQQSIFKDNVGNDEIRSSRNIYSDLIFFQDSLGEEAASSIRTDSDTDDEDSADEELLGIAALRLQSSSDAVIWNNVESGTRTSIMLPRHTSIFSRPKPLQVMGTIDEELPGCAALRLQRFLDAVLCRLAEETGRRSSFEISMPLKITIHTQQGPRRVVYGWHTQREQARILLDMCLAAACILPRCYCARYRSVIRDVFFAGAYFLVLTGIVLSIKV